MKKVIKLMSFLVAIAGVLFIQSCGEDEKIEPAPTVAVDPTSAQNIPGGVVSANLTITAPNGARDLVIYVAGEELETRDISAQDLSTAIEFEYTIPTAAVIGSKIVVSFQVVDNKDYPSAISNFVITVNDPVEILTGEVTAAKTLKKGQPYLVKGQYIVKAGVTLTVEAGAVIKGDKASKGVIIIQPGAKIDAVGTATEPIVFTSAQNIGERDRGDWGGIVWLGNAYVNQSARPAVEGISPAQNYGTVGTDVNANITEDNGKMKYVRIEYAGIELTPNNETNSLTMGGLGNATEIDYVQVSYGGDDGFEWFGGTVGGKHLVSLSTWDDDFDTDFGWRGNVQFGLVVRNPFFADQSGSTAFESDNQANGNAIAGICDGTTNTGCTQGVFSNVTVFGPRDFTTGLGSAGTSTRTISGNYTRAMHIRRRSSISIFNSVIGGFPTFLTMDDQGTLDNYTAGSGVLSNNVAFITDAEFTSGVASAAATVQGFWETGAVNEKVKSTANWSPTPGTPANSVNPYEAYGLDKGLFFGSQNSNNYPANPNFALLANGSLAAGAGFSNGKLGAFFDKTVAFRGAFGSSDWTDGWAEFQPLNKGY